MILAVLMDRLRISSLRSQIERKMTIKRRQPLGNEMHRQAASADEKNQEHA